MGDVRAEKAANMKALNFRALAVWICLFLFLVFLTLRLDDKIVWSWYIVFIPLWILDAVIFYLVAALAINIFSMTIAAPPRRARVIQLVGSDALGFIESYACKVLSVHLEKPTYRLRIILTKWNKNLKNHSPSLKWPIDMFSLESV